MYNAFCPDMLSVAPLPDRKTLYFLADAMPHLVWILDGDGHVCYFNQQWYDYTGLSFDDVKDDGWQERIYPDDRATFLLAREHSLATGEIFRQEARFRSNEGVYRWCESRGIAQRDSDGSIHLWIGTSTDIEEQKRIEEALRQSQERIRTFMNSKIGGVIVTEGDTIVDANDVFLRMTGYNRADVLSKTLDLSSLALEENAHVDQQALQQFATQQYVTTYETTYVCKDGSRLPVLAGAFALPGDPPQALVFLLDNSARKALEQRKDEFISMASHELKTPLTALKMQTSLLKRKLAKQVSYDPVVAISQTEAQVNKLTWLVGELLDVSKIQMDRLDYAEETVDLDALLQEVTETIQLTSTTHTIVIHGATQSCMVGDKERLEQVFINLINNAIKYSPQADTVEINLSASAKTATINVHDYGIGIPKAQREKIFERFYRAVTPDQKAFPGLGMGLYITAEIVKRHGGTIQVESDEGKGSTFQVTLPTIKQAKN